MSEKKEKFLLVDGNALVHRGFHAIPYLSTRSGELTNGVFGFASLFLNALNSLKPDYVAVSFDLKGPTFRDKLYKEYKATRVAAPEELYQQIPRVKDLVRAFNVPIYEKAGFEADDVIGTLASQADELGVETIILTGDFDTLQLVNHNIKVYTPQKGLSEAKLYTEKEVIAKYKGLRPDQLIDYKALRGDPSDNIPGVKGVGEKTAIELLLKFGDLDSIYKFVRKNADGGKKMKPRTAKLLLDSEKLAYLSRQLGEIVRDVPVKLSLKDTITHDFDEKRVVELFQELEFRTLLTRLPRSEKPVKSGKKMISNKDYHLVDSKDKLKVFLSEIKGQKEIVIDTETTSQHPVEARLVGVGFAWKEGEAYYLPAEVRSASGGRTKEGLPKEVKKILADKEIKKIGHNIKYDYLVLERAGILVEGIYFDTMIAAYLLNPGARSFGLNTLAFIELGYRMQPIEELLGKGKNQKTMAEVPVQEVSNYCCEDVDMTLQLKERLEKLLKEKGLDKLLFEIEMPLVEVLAGMENVGVKLDSRILQKLSQDAKKEIAKLEKKVYKQAGSEFNIASPLQLKEVLFEKLEIPTNNIKKGKTGFSTAASELNKLRDLHPIISLISEWREVSKLKSTYLDALPELVNKETGRIHTSFNQTIAATGRLSSTEPNLQNIPIRTKLGRKVRGAFVAKDGFDLVSIDYSQIELRIGAHLSGDKKMTRVFKEGGDIHTATASEVFDTIKPSAQERRYAKVINFGVLYGLSAFGLTERIPEVSRASAREFIKKYKSVYSGLDRYLKKVIEETRKRGFVENELGRIRNLREINSSQWNVRAAAERAAINMPLQSLAADVIKMAMNKLAEKDLTARDDCRLLIQVHDELLFEIKSSEVKKYAKEISKIMENVYKLKVPVEVDVKVGKNWEKMEKINF